MSTQPAFAAALNALQAETTLGLRNAASGLVRNRLAEARAIYGAAQLNKYALDPAKPIRITVVNGNVTLSGVVDSQADKDIANIQARGVSGVFKVTNNLQVAGSSQER